MLRFTLVLLLMSGLWLTYELTLGGAGVSSAATNPEGAIPVESTPAEPTPARVAERPSAPALDSELAVSAPMTAPAEEPQEEAPEQAPRRVALSAASVAAEATANDFLHSASGRAEARQAIKKASRMPPAEAVVAFTRLLEACMRGPIRKADTDARAVVDEAWTAMQAPLRRTVLNPDHKAKARTYKVASGDALERIAKRFRKQGLLLDAWTLAVMNRIDDPRRLRAGQELKIPVEPIRTVVEKQSFLAAMYVGDVIFRLYWVGHGREDRTPETTFTVSVKQEKPDWYSPDGRLIPFGHPENVLGNYFVKFEHKSFTGFGAHGTSEPATIGTMASLGCLRMADSDIEDFFKVVPRGSQVIIRSTP